MKLDWHRSLLNPPAGIEPVLPSPQHVLDWGGGTVISQIFTILCGVIFKQEKYGRIKNWVILSPINKIKKLG